MYILLVLNLPEGYDCLFLQLKFLNLKRFKKILKWFFLSLLLLLVALYIFVQTPWGQNLIVKQVTKRLSRDLNTEVSVKEVDFSLFNSMHLEGMLIRDRQKDTLLYAGDVKVRITDWFFFRKKAEFKYISLENAVVKFQRKDSVWSQQFLFDYFSSPSTGSKKKKGGIQFDLKQVELKNVLFIKKDEWLGQDLTVSVGAMQLEANDLNLSGSSYDIKSLVLKDPVFTDRGYTGLKPKDSSAVAGTTPAIVPDKDARLSWNQGGMEFKIANLKIENGTFRSDKNTGREPFAYFDGKHILFTEINGEISNAKFIGDTVFSRLTLSAKERSGLEIKKIEADLKMMPKGMAFSNLDLQTNRSTIRNYFSMSYDDINDMGDFIHKVRMTANLDGTYIDSDDIAFFAPNMSDWKKKIALRGKIRGTVDDLVGRDMIIQAGTSTFLNGDVTLTGLPDINQTFIDFKANDFRTTYTDAVTIIPAIRTITAPDLKKIQYVNFTGSFTGFIRDFVTYGTIRTNLGVVKSDLNMKLPAGGQPVYSGNISTDNFQLGTFLGDKKIGAVSMEGVVKGTGFSEKYRNAEVKGNIRFVDYNNYRYHNIAIEKGKLDKKLFDGTVSINDENAELTLNGVIDFNTKNPVFNFLADVRKANLKNLNLTKDDLAFTGKFNLDFTGSTIDNFLGTAKITEASLTKDGNRLPFDSLTLSSSYANNIKTLKASSNEFEGTITGDFNIAELPDAVQLFLNKYYPAYIKAPKKMPVNESFTFDLTTNYVEDYIKLIDSSLTGFNYSHISGNLDMQQSQLNLVADIPYFKYGKQDFNEVTLTAKGTLDSLLLIGGAKNIYINDSISVPQATFRISGSNDVSQVNIFAGANQTLDKANISALVRTYNDGVKIEFNPSDFMVNGKTWTIDENGELQFRTNTPASGLLVLREGDQEIKLRTEPSKEGSWNDLIVDLKKVNLGDLSPYVMPKGRLEGLFSGNLLVEDPTGKNMRVVSDNIKTEYLRLDNDSLGEVNADLVYDSKTKELTSKFKTANQENYLEGNLHLFFGDKTQQKNNLIALRPRNFQLSILERFLGNIFSDIQGYLTGNVDLQGEFTDLDITGKGKLKDAGLKINFTQCFYKIEDTDLELTPHEIKLDGLVLKDTVTGNPIYVEGGIEHNSFKDMFYNINVSTQKKLTNNQQFNKPVQLLNTTYHDNQQFYGKVMGTGSFSLVGPQSDMYMAINAVASDKDSSYITIPPSKSRESGIADFLVERKYGREMDDSSLRNSASNIIYDVKVTANPMVNVKVQIDDITGDEIKGNGTGTLNIRSGTSEPLTMRGRFDISKGNYLFTFQSLFKKQFELKEGGDNYITFNGDPYNAQIQFDAQYTASKVSFSPLVSALNLDQSISKYREDVYVIANLTGPLFKPRFKLSLDFPANSKAKTDPSISLNVEQMEKNETEVIRQVAYLVTLNSFAPLENSTTSSTGIGSAVNEFTYTAISSLSGMFFNVINKKLNSEISRILKTDNISVNFSGSLYNRNLLSGGGSGFGLNQGNFGVNVPISLFKDRLFITLGSTFDVPLQSNIQQTVQFLPDVTIEWLFNQTGTVRASIFYRQNIDDLATTSTGAAKNKRSGANISFRREFDHLFKKKKPVSKEAKPATIPEADKPKESSKTEG